MQGVYFYLDVIIMPIGYLLYRYTSLGSTFNTLPNPALRHPKNGQETGAEDAVSYLPAYKLEDGGLERAGRIKLPPPLGVAESMFPSSVVEISKPATAAPQA